MKRSMVFKPLFIAMMMIASLMLSCKKMPSLYIPYDEDMVRIKNNSNVRHYYLAFADIQLYGNHGGFLMYPANRWMCNFPDVQRDGEYISIDTAWIILNDSTKVAHVRTATGYFPETHNLLDPNSYWKEWHTEDQHAHFYYSLTDHDIINAYNPLIRQ